MTEQSRKLFLIGPGYSARQLAALCQADSGWTIYGTARNRDKAEALAPGGIRPVLTDDAAGLEDAGHASHWVISTPPNEDGCPGFSLTGAQASNAASITYLSTTGVYGDLKGGWAFEWLANNPGKGRSERRETAEHQWLSARPDARIVRLPGIYGPGRSQLDRLRGGKTEQIIKPGQVFSRIHVEDLAAGLKALIEHPETAGVYNLCDDEPAPPQDVMDHAAHLLGLPMPRRVDIDHADVSEMAKSFYSECKRVPNAKLKAATGWRPVYPDYRRGLDAILAPEKN